MFRGVNQQRKGYRREMQVCKNKKGKLLINEDEVIE